MAKDLKTVCIFYFEDAAGAKARAIELRKSVKWVHLIDAQRFDGGPEACDEIEFFGPVPAELRSAINIAHGLEDVPAPKRTKRGKPDVSDLID